MMQNLIKIYQRFKIAVFSILLVPLFWFGIRAGWNQANSDFPNYYVSAKLMLNGKLNDAYHVDKFNAHIHAYNTQAQGLFVMYPPTTAIVMIGLTPFDILNAKRLWMLISVAAAIGIIIITSKLISIDFIDASILFLISGFNLYNDLMLGQVYLLMIFLLLSGYAAIKNNQIITGSVLWGMVAAIKFLPLFFIPVLWYKKQYKLVFNIIVTFLSIHLITLSIAGIEAYQAFFDVFIQNYMQGKVANSTATSIQYQSVEVFIYQLNQAYNLPNWLGIFMKISWKLIWILVALVIINKYKSHQAFKIISVSTITLLLLLFENGSASYHLLFGIIALLCLFELEVSKTSKLIAIILYASMGFLPFVMHLLPFKSLLINFGRLWCLSLFAASYFLALKKHLDFIN